MKPVQSWKAGASQGTGGPVRHRTLRFDLVLMGVVFAGAALGQEGPPSELALASTKGGARLRDPRRVEPLASRRKAPPEGESIPQAAEAPGALESAERADGADGAVDEERASAPRPTTRAGQHVTIQELLPPREEMLIPSHELTMPPWSLFEESTLYEEAPEVAGSAKRSMFYAPPPKKSGFAVAVERLARRKLASEVRRFMKREWRDQFIATPTMSYARYIDGISRINKMGREQRDFEFANTEHFSNEFKDDLFGRPHREGEEDFEAFGWGPFVLMDSGSVNFDLGKVVHYDPRGLDPDRDSALQPESKPILATEDYRVSTSVKLSVNPLGALKEDPSWAFRRYGLGVEVSWLSDVLGREVMTTEFEVEVERNGEFAAIVNFIFRSRN